MSDDIQAEKCAEPVEDHSGLTIYFNPFAFTIEENNAFIAAGYEPMPMVVPKPEPIRIPVPER